MQSDEPIAYWQKKKKKKKNAVSSECGEERERNVLNIIVDFIPPNIKANSQRKKFGQIFAQIQTHLINILL